ncbi:iron ABC transporter permease [Clostridia bacterium OttesenSCG-928-O13]|nr:iron ABC transporter permease [Clostridia bacterium OttesenSCG-928-O13]
METKAKPEGFRLVEYLIFAAVTLAVFVLCVCVGSVTVPPGETFAAIRDSLFGSAASGGNPSIIVSVRLPRVVCVALVGASLSLCGASMQGLLRNPLADGSTLGVSSGASLGAVIAIAFGISIPGFPASGSMPMAMLFAFCSLVLILGLANRLDYSLATNTIILIGVVFSMFASSLTSLVVTFAGDKVKNIVFWTMGSLAGSNWENVIALFIALVVCGFVMFRYARELNAFSIGEDNARHVGIDVKRVKYTILIAVSILIGVSVSIGGTIGFVGLVIPHITRMVTGPNHRRLLPASLFTGAVFLMLADLVSRVLLRPRELPIGVVTSMVGAVVFVYIFYSTRKGR